VTWAVIGAGYAGIAVAAALLEAGLEVDVLDAREQVGGLWRDGVYDDVRLITTRKVTAYAGRPLPPGDLFPAGKELLSYLETTAEDTGVLERFQGGRRVQAVTPASDGWDVDGSWYDGVVLATGLFSEPRIPDAPGTSTIPALHTADYKNVGQLGSNVLVVGMGTSGADVAQACAEAGKRVTLAVGQSRHVLPRRVLGRPVVEMQRPRGVPDLPVRIALDAWVRVLSAYWRRGRLGEPRHLLLQEVPLVHSGLLPLLAQGRIAVKPEVVGLDGDRVGFADRSSATYDTIVWATGYRYHLPVDRALLDGSSSAYGQSSLSLVGGAWSPVSRGLAAVGHREPRNGRGPYLSALARVVAAGALAQARTDEPIGQVLAREAAPTDGYLIDDGPELRRLERLVATAAQTR
jgi:cation diffusion facilitator CzcD-associated flavoprotein CzcO